MTRLDSPASCVDYSPDGELLVVGFGRRARSTGTGSIGSASGVGTSESSSGGAWRRGAGGKRGKPGSGDGGSDNGGGGGAKTGGFIVLNEADFVTVFEARDAKKVRRMGKRGRCGWARRMRVDTLDTLLIDYIECVYVSRVWLV